MRNFFMNTLEAEGTINRARGLIMRKYLFKNLPSGILLAVIRTASCLLMAAIGLVLQVTPARAGTATFDLNTQPTTEFVFTGTAEWQATVVS